MSLIISEIQRINLNNLEPNPYQPRKEFPEEGIEQMAESIKKVGLIQKITVIPQMDENFRPIQDKFFIISGERRYRAYRRLAEETGEKEYNAIEAVVVPIDRLTKETYDYKLMYDSFLENIDRQDLTPVEKAEAIAQIKAKTGLTYGEIAEKLGKKEGYIKNLISINNKLSDEQREKAKKEKMGERKIKEMIKEDKEKANPEMKKEIAVKNKKNITISIPKEFRELEKEEQFKTLDKLYNELLDLKSEQEVITYITDYSAYLMKKAGINIDSFGKVE